MFVVAARGGKEDRESGESSVPKTMKAIQMTEFRKEGYDHLKVVDIKTPECLPGEVLIRVEASPITSKDLAFIRGGSAAPFKGFPVIPGFECIGVVVESGGGLTGWSLLGKRVAITIPHTVDNGCWAEYAKVPTDYVVDLDDLETPIDILCRIFSESFQAMSMIETLKHGGHKAGIHTDAASPFGRMLLRLAIKEKVPFIHIVHKPEELDVLRNIGAEYVLCTKDESFQENLRSLSKALGATIAFDSICGSVTGIILSAMPMNSTLQVYGAYDNEDISGINVNELMSRKKKLAGLYPVEYWLVDQNMFSLNSAIKTARRLIDAEIRDKEVVMRAELDSIVEAIQKFEGVCREAKPGGPRHSVCITPNPPREVIAKLREQKEKEQEAVARLKRAEEEQKRKAEEKKAEKEKKKEEEKKEEKVEGEAPPVFAEPSTLAEASGTDIEANSIEQKADIDVFKPPSTM